MEEEEQKHLRKSRDTLTVLFIKKNTKTQTGTDSTIYTIRTSQTKVMLYMRRFLKVHFVYCSLFGRYVTVAQL